MVFYLGNIVLAFGIFGEFKSRRFALEGQFSVDSDMAGPLVLTSISDQMEFNVPKIELWHVKLWQFKLNLVAYLTPLECNSLLISGMRALINLS